MDDRTTPRGDELAEPAHDDLERQAGEEAAGTASHSPGTQDAPPAAEQVAGGRAEVPPLRHGKRG
jgi:hypothetical protein